MNEAVREFLADILPDTWTPADTPWFAVSDEHGPVALTGGETEIDGDRCVQVLREEDGGLSATVAVTRVPDNAAFTVQVTLVNDSNTQRALREIRPLRFSWRTDEQPVYARTVGGGVNEPVYPPNAFRVWTYRFAGGGFVWKEHGFDGRSSNDTVPVMVMTAGDSGLVAAMEWSGLWKLQGQGRPSGDLRVDGVLMHCSPVLEPGRSLSLPVVHCMVSTGGLDGATNACRRYVKQQLLPSLSDRPTTPFVAFNHWFDIGAAIDEPMMFELADKAVELGAEYFVVDAGWYGGCDAADLPPGRESFEVGVGNWEKVDTAKFPNGLKPLAQRVQGHGMKLGIWFEFERAHRSSDWATSHPEWFIDIGREYLHIDMNNPEARAAIGRVMDGVVEELGVAWIKLDYNIGPRPYWEQADPTGAIQLGYMQGLYDTLQSFRERHPQVVLECCASGGRRIDFGMLKHQHTAFLSDHSRLPETVRYMLLGANHLFPACADNLGINLGPGREYPPLSPYALASRMLGALTLFGDIRALNDDQVALVAGMVDTFKGYRHLLDQDFFPLLAQPADDAQWDAAEFISHDRREAVVFVFSGYEEPLAPPPIILKALRPDSTYRITDLFTGDTVEKSIEGSTLLNTPRMLQLNPHSFAAWHLTTV